MSLSQAYLPMMVDLRA